MHRAQVPSPALQNNKRNLGEKSPCRVWPTKPGVMLRLIVLQRGHNSGQMAADSVCPQRCAPQVQELLPATVGGGLFTKELSTSLGIPFCEDWSQDAGIPRSTSHCRVVCLQQHTVGRHRSGSHGHTDCWEFLASNCRLPGSGGPGSQKDILLPGSPRGGPLNDCIQGHSGLLCQPTSRPRDGGLLTSMNLGHEEAGQLRSTEGL